jgi:dephospho-CoA kinase
VLKVGLTGNIASGKSSVAAVWSRLGATVVDADLLARRAVEPGTSALRQIVELWGPEMLDPAGALDRGRLREIVFRDPVARSALESIVHPAVAELRDRAFREAEERGERVVVADVPLLYEVGLESEFDLVVLVDAPAGERERRLVDDRGLDPGTARRMMDSQMPAEEKRRRADVVLENDGTMEALARRAEAVWREILLEARDA